MVICETKQRNKNWQFCYRAKLNSLDCTNLQNDLDVISEWSKNWRQYALVFQNANYSLWRHKRNPIMHDYRLDSQIVYKKCVRSGKPWWYTHAEQPLWTRKGAGRATIDVCYDWNQRLNNAEWFERWFPELWYFISTQNDVYQRYLEKDFGKIF